MSRWQFWIDVGGTFTDCIAQSPQGDLLQWKTLSSGAIKGEGRSDGSRRQLIDAARAASRPDLWAGWCLTSPDLLDRFPDGITIAGSTCDGSLTLCEPLPTCVQNLSYELRCEEQAPLICVRQLLQLRLDDPLPDLDMRLGTTRGTNALLERKGAPTALLVTAGFADLLEIGNQDRPVLFALNIQKVRPLSRCVVEVPERLSADGTVLQPLDLNAVQSSLEALHRQGITSLAICLLHAYRNDLHERQVADLAAALGFRDISCSSAVAPVIKAVPRAETTLVDAYLNPVLRHYVEAIHDCLTSSSTLRMMTSHGGLIEGLGFSGKDSILSGPAGGVIACSRIAEAAGFPQAIGFDMGGTSTDVSRYGGEFDLESETVKAGIRIATPMLAIETVAAGGGSICSFDGFQLQVGPESAGADPGPACYGKGGPLTVTDANVALRRVLPEHFPFPLHLAAVDARLDAIRHQLQSAPSPRDYTRQQLAQGYIDIANEIMARAIRAISVRKGYAPQDHVLVCFGGAGGQHACALARILGMKSILVHPFSGVLSAFGMGLADIRRHARRMVLRPFTPEAVDALHAEFAALEQSLRQEVLAQGVSESSLDSPVRSLGLRYRQVEQVIFIPLPDDGDYRRAYEAEHLRRFGYLQPDRPLEIVSLSVEVVGRLTRARMPLLAAEESAPVPAGETTCWHAGVLVQASVFHRADLKAGQSFSGPAILCDAGSTIWVEPGVHACLQPTGEVLLHLGPESEAALSAISPEKALEEAPDPVLLEIFNNQFASIAEQMGVTLRKTSLSTNVKERLDYSCALFDPQGGLVVNAPHIPVHLGAMGETVRCLLNASVPISPGDVLVTNDPYAGGSHLPDLTVITPVHDETTGELLFLTASRAHHAEIGGITPGSMPPFSRILGEEGVLIQNFKIVEQGVSRFEAFHALLQSGSWPSRSPGDNLADVAAQIAANRMGSELLLALVRKESHARVHRYMQHIQNAAEAKMRQALARIPDGQYHCLDWLDQGAPVEVTITIAGEQARIDFSGTGPVQPTNLNANRAIVTAAVMYVFRCLINEDLPLNSGVLHPLTIHLPEGLLNPPVHSDRSQCAAVVGGNVEVSQRVVDVLCGALQIAAASQGTMNNLTFGDATFGYYETICGGAGATPDAAGADAVHTHMTNTRLTDVEVLESRYPVLVREFSIRHGSGGNGRFSGGSGVRRVLEFLRPLSVSLLTQRRGPWPPFGLQGGRSGSVGRNLLQRSGTEAVEDLGAAAQVNVSAGDRLIIETPGGGGFGSC